ncbi:dipeptide/oligopeptide/nickel ABC transporter permease/ATP-binding protein [Amycolatopsis jejuensis]|uniref:dipeptide/oligopeptide/nickel ABC transporter permease/ATP-binding protein n=1 Tax=Amycolatopsis jejuensis TaxID=330084 RepID=UPI00068FFE4D|nr:dipeptide/oligopeptide/nickel ABC transporter permease/ATP-binding protein [Amycolatopsis jejuensis]
MSTAEALPARTVDAAPRFARRLLRNPMALVCLAFLAVVIGVAVIAPVLWPDVAAQQAGDLLAAKRGPSGGHPLGTDALGRDMLDRLLVGARPTVIGVAEALVVVLAVGVPLGLVAGFFGGRLDRIISWIADLMFATPAIVIILVVLSVFPQNMAAAMVTFGVIAAPGLLRIVRSATLPVRQELYVDAALVAGLSRSYIIVRHVLPRIAGPVIVQASLLASIALQVQAGLSFLQLVVPIPAPSWGGMVADGMQVIEQQPWLVVPPGLAIALTVLALGLLGDAVRDATTEGWTVAIPRRPHRRAASSGQAQPIGSDGDSGALLSIDGLRVAYSARDRKTTILDGVGFTVDPGETVGIVGESGCGKTTAAMAILGLLQGTGTIEAGSIRFGGRDLAALPERELRKVRGKEIGLISQEPMVSLNPAFRVGWQLAEALRQHRGLSRKDARAGAIDLLRQVQLPDAEAVARRYPHELSGGMAQRVSIARALAGRPKLLIADEPTTALDVTVQAEILTLLRKIQAEEGMAILLVTHDWGVVADICDRAIVMYAGQVVEHADLDSMFRRPLHPYTESLLASNPYHALDDEALPTIPGDVPKPGEWPSGCHFHPRCRYATAECREVVIPLRNPEPGRLTRCIHHETVARSDSGAVSV